MEQHALTSRTWVLAAATLCLAGCLPDDEIRGIAFSPEGSRIAAVSVKRGITVLDARTGARTRITSERVRGERVAWSPDGSTLAFNRETSGAWTIATAQMDGTTTQVTTGPERSTDPFFVRDGRIGWVSWGEDQPALTLTGIAPLTNATNPAPSPDGSEIAFVDWGGLLPQVCTVRVDGGGVSRLTSETTLLGLRAESLHWSPDSRHLAFVRETTYTARQKRWLLLESEVGGKAGPRIAGSSTQPIASPTPTGDGSIWFLQQGRLMRIHRQTGVRREVMTDGLAASLLDSASGADVAFVTADQLVGIARPESDPRFLIPDPEAQFLLAEEYYRTGRDARSRELYAELLASVRGAADPALAEFVGVINAGRLGREAEAARQLQRLLLAGKRPAEIPERTLWRVLGLIQLVAEAPLTDTRNSLERYASIPIPPDEARETTVPGRRGLGDAGLNALAILRSGDPVAARLLGQAIGARLRGNPTATEASFARLLARRPESIAVQAEYLRALEGFDREVFFFSPGRRDFPMTDAARIHYLSRFAELCPGSPLAPRARFDLFRLCVSTRREERARTILSMALVSSHRAQDLEGTADFFRSFLDIPEREPWLEDAMRGVFLRPELRPRLEEALRGPRERLAMHLCAAKMALIRGDTARAQRACDAAERQWERIPESDRTPSDYLDLSRLGVFRARSAELAGEFALAADLCAGAASAAVTTASGQFDFALEARFRASLLRAAAQPAGATEREILRFEKEAGDDLVNPKWQEEFLVRTAEHFASIAIRPSCSGRQSLAALEAGIAAAKLKRLDAARAALLRAAEAPVPWIREKALVELTALSETENDPWDALRRLRELAAMGGLDPQLVTWLRIRAARHELGLGVNAEQARAALGGVIRDWPPDSPLGAFARGVAENAP